MIASRYRRPWRSTSVNTVSKFDFKRNEYLLGLGILDGSDEAADLVAHGLRSDARGCRLEVNIARASDASVRYESGCGHGADKSRCSDTVEAD